MRCCDGVSLWHDCDRDFASEAVIWGFQQGMGEANVSKRVDRANMWPQLSARDQCAQLIKLVAILSGENEVIAGVLAPGLDQVLWLSKIHDRDHAAKLCERVGAARQCVATDGVEHHIYSVATGFSQDGVDVIFLLVIDHHVGAHAPCELKVCFAHRGKNPGAYGFCQLN